MMLTQQRMMLIMLVMMLLILVMILLMLVMRLMMIATMVRRGDSASLPEAPIYRICPALASGSELSCTSYFVRFLEIFIFCQLFPIFSSYNLIGISIVSSSDAKSIVQDPAKWKAYFCVSAPHFLVYVNHRGPTDDEKGEQAAKRKLHLFHR